MELLIGIDIGTTNIKAAAYDIHGKLAGEASRPTPSQAEGQRRSSIDPYMLARTTADCLVELASHINPHHVAGVAVASIGESGVLLDKSGQPLFPIIAWYDERTLPQSRQVSEKVGDMALYQTTGLPPGHTYSLHKLLWLKQECGSLFDKAHCWLAVCDWVALTLGGGLQMGYSQASRTLALNLAKRSWWQDGLQELDLPRDILPELLPEGSFVGSISSEAANRTGLREGTPIYLAGHDHVCGAFARGVTEPGIVLDSTGTTETELTSIGAIDLLLRQGNLSFCLGCHVVHGRYYATGGILGAGSLINWIKDLYWPGQDNASGTATEALSSLAAASPPGAHGLYLLPHLAGAGSPDRSSTARGVIAGLNTGHTRADLARAAFEGLAWEVDALWNALEEFTACPINRIVTVGGGARNSLWNQLKADISGHILTIPANSEAVAQGAALLAGLGAGIYADENDAVNAAQQTESTITPEPAGQRFYLRHRAYIRQVRQLAVELGRLSGELVTTSNEEQ